MEAIAISVTLGMLVIVSITALLAKRLLVSVILMSVFSLLSALLFYLCDAPDVAITEAAVGAGVSTFIYVWAIHKTSHMDDDGKE
ncbi:Na(+)/H(+) antiporter subunit B [Sediminispirochaeta bajacaliforniensis]|uniref:Na(+)/H(+) antiporter subunit B n=1 Tax=Sediminispirochaeta bajacaliforniensis TaxID=148 RepID=UPI0003651363|nr:hydrogenase subunit MbhD domain-containing protein [Sediminispirochaeta bajacaliforniensis]